MSIEIRQVDPGDAAQLRAWWEVGRDATADRQGDEWPAWEASRVALPAPNPEREIVLTAAHAHGRVVGAGMLRLPRLDNLHTATVDVWVRPPSRRTGIGSTLLTDLELRASGRDRGTLQAEVFVVPGQDAPGRDFAARHGYAEAHREEMKVLELEELERRRPALEAEVSAAIGDYRVVGCTRIPDEHLQGFCDLLSDFYSQIPLGDLDVEDSEWTPARVRAWEAREEQVGSLTYTALALAADGAVVGMSDAGMDQASPHRASVGITIVRPDHRGHRLGLALKLANHAAVRRAHPECTRVTTSNAPVNERMNDVNARMGYVVVESCLEYQKVL